MIKKDWIYNKECIVILPQYANIEAFEYSFKNIYILDTEIPIKNQIKIINSNNFKQIIFVDYLIEYREMIMNLEKNHSIKFIFTKALGALPNNFYNLLLTEILKLYEEKHIERVGFLDINLYEIYKNKIRCSHISLDIEKKEYDNNYTKDRIGVLNDSENNMHSFFNSLCALRFNNYTASINKMDPKIKNVTSLFDINYEIKGKDNINNNLLNLYINFTDNDNTIFLKSMDRNIPCILGNNELIKNTTLEKYLTVNSDDNIDEISEKIESVKENRERIIELYDKYRTNYSKKSREEIKEFLSIEQNLIIEKETEILIINDGSTDQSEKIIKEYLEKNKHLIRYIKQENHGLGNVRNVGMKEAKGKYIASIDSDDTINKDFFTTCLNDLIEDVDIVVYDWITITNTTKFETAAIDYIFNNGNLYEGLIYTSIMASACNKIVKKSLFDSIKYKYVEDKYEDLSITPLLLLKASTIKYINKPYYEYYVRSNSIMRSSVGFSMINIINELNK